MDDMDIDKLISALDDEDNTDLLELDFNKIETEKAFILEKLKLPKKQLKELMKKLRLYRYIDELPGMKYGSYIRWISLRNPENLRLTNGGVVCEMKVADKGIIIVCKNKLNRFFQLNMSEALIFQRLTEQELVLLSALEYINA